MVASVFLHSFFQVLGDDDPQDGPRSHGSIRGLYRNIPERETTEDKSLEYYGELELYIRKCKHKF